jgi:hypothetical protein
VDGALIITNDEKDSIGKLEMAEEFKNRYPDKYLTCMQIMMSLKEKKIKYSAKFRNRGVQGCYYGVKIRDDDDIDKYFSHCRSYTLPSLFCGYAEYSTKQVSALPIISSHYSSIT